MGRTLLGYIGGNAMTRRWGRYNQWLRRVRTTLLTTRILLLAKLSRGCVGQLTPPLLPWALLDRLNRRISVTPGDPLLQNLTDVRLGSVWTRKK